MDKAAMFAEDRELLKREFDRFDTDHNGRLDYQEFVRLLEAVGPRPTEEEARLAFSIIDEDGSGTVNFEEFVDWWLDR